MANYFDMLPNDIQDLIFAFKISKEIKHASVSKMKKDLETIEHSIVHYNVCDDDEYDTMPKLPSLFYAYETMMAWLYLEDKYEDPKTTLGAVEYTLVVYRMRGSWKLPISQNLKVFQST